MAKKTISNTFTVNTVDDGESAFDVTLDNQIAGVECDKNGDIVGDINITFRISAHYGSNDVIGACTITDNHEDVDSDIDVSYSQQQIGLVTLYLNDGNGLRDTNVIAFTVVHPQYGTRVVSFTIKRIINGESAPFYNDEWYAWSNDSSTASVTTEPTISGSWSHSIPNQGGLAYLWKKIIRYDYNTSIKDYVQGSAQYYRMSGTNGTSINIKGTIKVAITASGTFPTSGFSNGDLGVKQGDSYMWQFNGSSWSHVSSASSDGDSYTMTKDCTIDLDGDGTSENIKGHLIQWSTEVSKWIDLGQFKGESGVTYYTHIAWATGVTLIPSPSTKPAGQQNIPNASNVQGGVIVPSGADLPWMGYLIDTNVSDSTDYTLYTWSETKGAKGDDAITYEVMCSRENITIPSGETSTSATISFNFFSKEGDSPKQVFYTYWSLYKRENDGTMTFLFAAPTKSSYARNLSLPATTSESAFVMYIWGDNRYTGNTPESQPYLAKAEVAVLKDGDAAVVYKIEFEKNTFAHNPNTNKLAISVQGTVYKIEGATSTPVALTNGNFRLYKVAGNTQVRILPTLSSSVFSYTSNTDFNNETLLKAQLTIDSSVVVTECIQIVTDGTSGARGKVGRFYYFAGTFNEEDEDTQFVVNDAQVPYFEHLVDGQKRYHVFNPETTPEGGSMTMAQMWAASNQSWNNAPWEVMTNDFKYLITEALFGKYANLGSFLINEDWLMSNLGSVAGNTNSQISYKEWKNNNWVNMQAPAYTFFDATELKEDKTSVWAITEPWMEGEKETFNLLDGLYYFECTVKNCLITLTDEYNYSYILVDTTSGGQVASSFLLKLPHSGNYTLNMYEYSVGDGAEVIVAGGFYKAQFVPFIAIDGRSGQIYHSGGNGSFYAKWLEMQEGWIGRLSVTDRFNVSRLSSNVNDDITHKFTQLTSSGQLVLRHTNYADQHTDIDNNGYALYIDGGICIHQSNLDYEVYSDSNGFLKIRPRQTP